MLLKILPFALYANRMSVQALEADHAYITYLMLQRRLSHLSGRKLDRRQN
jgi:hypothetical protein